jgi:hypothetical protein
MPVKILKSKLTPSGHKKASRVSAAGAEAEMEAGERGV